MLRTSRCHALTTVCRAAVAAQLAGVCALAQPSTLTLEPLDLGTEAASSVDAALELPGELEVPIHAPTSGWFTAESLAFSVTWPPDAPTNAQVLVHMMDWDYLWFQQLMPGRLKPGLENRFEVDLKPDGAGWEARKHHATWHHRALVDPKAFAVRIFGDEPYRGTCRVDRAAVTLSPAVRPPPWIRHVRTNGGRVPCFEKFEVSLQIPDRYANPFDPETVTVTADFQTPSGALVKIDGFYASSFYRTDDEAGETLIPQGPPAWHVRYAPLEPGVYRYTLTVRDAHGQSTWGPSTFEATPPRTPGFVRVSTRDPRYFEFSNGTFFFPIGHNIRSPFDTRMNEQFPWVQRWPAGASLYSHYFKAMQKHRENLAEIWSASWSLGLEWNREWPGYHGIGQYNMAHAWEMDRIVEAAEAHGIYINLVILNHGKFSTYSDEEWADNPLNRANGGYLDKPEEFFSDPRALRDFRKLMRYMIARWGYSPHVFAWQLWSELDLTGSTRNYFKCPEVVDWHRLMARTIKDMDPNDHLVATHCSGDYTHQYEPIITLPEIDHCPVDAYYKGQDSMQIVKLLADTAAYHNPFGKPVIATEFGGSHLAGNLAHLDASLHAGLWASTCIPVGGTPLFWWWQLIEEENFYPKYRAVGRFMDGEDQRDPALLPATLTLTLDNNPAATLDARCIAGGRRAFGWVYQPQAFADGATGPATPVSNLVATLSGMAEGPLVAEFWDTIEGRAFHSERLTAGPNGVRLDVPPFTRDVAFKLRAP